MLYMSRPAIQIGNAGGQRPALGGPTLVVDSYILDVLPGLCPCHVRLPFRIASAHPTEPSRDQPVKTDIRSSQRHHLSQHVVCPNAVIFSNPIHHDAPYGEYLSARDRSHPRQPNATSDPGLEARQVDQPKANTNAKGPLLSREVWCQGLPAHRAQEQVLCVLFGAEAQQGLRGYG